MPYDKQDLIRKYLENSLDAEETKLFEAWKQSEPGNTNPVEALASFRKDGVPYPDLTTGEFLQKIGSDPDANWARILQHISENNKTVHLRPPAYRWILRIAAALVLVSGAVYLLNQGVENTSPGIKEMQLAISPGEDVKSIRLEDGTQVWLSPGSSLSYPETFDPETRTVMLDGEAFFEVERNDHKPFVVTTGHSLVKVLGTSFNVNTTSQNATIVSVVSGVVSMASKSMDKSVVLEKGYVGKFTPSDGRLVRYKNIDLNFLSWKTGTLTFSDQTLDKVLKDLSRHYRVTIRTPDNALEDKRVTATFHDQSLEEVLAVIGAMHDIRFVESGPGVISMQQLQ